MEWAWSPLGIAILWIFLHSADYLLTIATARTFARGDLRSRLDMGGGSVELNPVFQRAVDRGAWVSRRFLVTLILGALVFYALFTVLRTFPPEAIDPLWFAAEALAGMLVVTRLVVIAGHLQNLVLFRRMLLDPAAAGVRIRYDRGTVFTGKRWGYLQPAALCALAFAVAPRPFFLGGAAGMLLLAAATLVWQWREPRRGGSSAPSAG